MIAILNFFIKLWFYPRYFLGATRMRFGDVRLFSSYDINDDTQWMTEHGWRRTRRLFRFGLVCFRARMDGKFTEDFWPALWLMCEYSPSYYNEIDIELTIKSRKRPYLNLAIWNNPYENATGSNSACIHHRVHLRNQAMIHRLRTRQHAFHIDWRRRWIRFYINGLLCGTLPDAPQYPMRIVVGYATVQKVVMYDNN